MIRGCEGLEKINRINTEVTMMEHHEIDRGKTMRAQATANEQDWELGLEDGPGRLESTQKTRRKCENVVVGMRSPRVDHSNQRMILGEEYTREKKPDPCNEDELYESRSCDDDRSSHLTGREDRSR